MRVLISFVKEFKVEKANRKLKEGEIIFMNDNNTLQGE